MKVCLHCTFNNKLAIHKAVWIYVLFISIWMDRTLGWLFNFNARNQLMEQNVINGRNLQLAWPKKQLNLLDVRLRIAFRRNSFYAVRFQFQRQRTTLATLRPSSGLVSSDFLFFTFGCCHKYLHFALFGLFYFIVCRFNYKVSVVLTVKENVVRFPLGKKRGAVSFIFRFCENALKSNEVDYDFTYYRA